MNASAERIRQDIEKWDGQENRQDLTGNLIEVVKQEVEEKERNESNDYIRNTQLSSTRKIIDRSSVGELETLLEANERPLRMKRKLQCIDYDTEEVHLNSRSPKSKRKMGSVDGNSGDAYSCVMKRAKEVRAKLDHGFPSFLKLMLRSHVSGGFWLHIPSSFCKLHMPKHDQSIDLEDETGRLFVVKYIADKMGLSAGWKGFSILHDLLEGDVIVFHLVLFNKFKVYIVRASNSGEIDGALYNSNLNANAEEKDLGSHGGKNNTRCTSGEEKSYPFLSSIASGRDESKNGEDSLCKNAGGGKNNTRCTSGEEKSYSFPPYFTSGRDESKNGEDSLYKNADDGFQGSFVEFQEFKITVNDVVIDSLLSEDVRRNYYELCLARNSYLHDLLKSDNNMLAAGIITETTKIANYIRGCKLSTSNDDFAMWDKRLEGFEVLGMDVRFLRSRLSYLVNIASKMREMPRLKRYAEARLERDCREEEIQTLKSRLRELKQAKRKLDDDIAVLKVEVGSFELIFEEEANISW